MSKEPEQMTEDQMWELIVRGVDPVKICIQKYEMFGIWVRWMINNDRADELFMAERTGSDNCALCAIYSDHSFSCPRCPLDKAGDCCNKEGSSWRKLEDIIDEFSDISSDAIDESLANNLYEAIEVMKGSLQDILADPNYTIEVEESATA